MTNFERNYITHNNIWLVIAHPTNAVSKLHTPHYTLQPTHSKLQTSNVIKLLKNKNEIVTRCDTSENCCIETTNCKLQTTNYKLQTTNDWKSHTTNFERNYITKQKKKKKKKKKMTCGGTSEYWCSENTNDTLHTTNYKLHTTNYKLRTSYIITLLNINKIWLVVAHPNNAVSKQQTAKCTLQNTNFKLQTTYYTIRTKLHY